MSMTSGKSRSSKARLSPSSSASSMLSGSKNDRKIKARNFKEEERETLAYKVLPADKTKEFLELESIETLQSQLCEFLQLICPDGDLKESSILDYYVAGFWWAREQGFVQEQASAFYTVLHMMLENVKEKHLSITDCMKELKKLFAGIGQDQPENSAGLDCFDVAQAKSIADYFYKSLLQHYNLYEFAFSHSQAEEIIGTDLEVETPFPANIPWPPPLDESVPEYVYDEYIAPPAETSEEMAGEDAAGGDAEAGDVGDVDPETAAREAELLAQLTPDEVRTIMDSVFDEMLGGLKSDVASKLRDKENAFINRINKIHRVAESPQQQ